MSDCSLTAGREQITIGRDDDDVHFVLDQYASKTLKKQSMGRHVAPLGHIIMTPNRPVFTLILLLNYAYLAEKQQIPML